MERNNAEESQLSFLSEAEILLKQNKLFEALNFAESRLQQFPWDIDAYIIAAHAFIIMDKTDDAANILRKIEKKISDLSTIYIRLGDIYLEKGLYRDTLQCYKKYISLNPDSDKAKEIAGKIVRLEREEPLIAESEENDGTKTKPEFQTVTLADLYIRQGHFSLAAGILETIIQNEPDNELARTKLETVRAAIATQKSTKIDAAQSDFLIATMTRWLENINRLKSNDEKKK